MDRKQKQSGKKPLTDDSAQTIPDRELQAVIDQKQVEALAAAAVGEQVVAPINE